jgi:uncharacterized NAD(P)/FAD-binding protein YdhS
MAGRTVAVVGGGCAGVLTVRELLRCTDDEVILIEPGRPGGGVAYGAARPWHLLNSRAGAMSADPDDADHFVRWANARGIAAAPRDFLSRRDYGDYLDSVFAETAAAHPGRLRVLRARATGLHPDAASCSVTLTPTGRVGVDHVVLATGNPAGAQLAAVPAVLRGHPGYVADPWRDGALDGIPVDARVLLIGAGLTAIDVALTLTADGRRRAPIVAVSRRGQLPLAHTVAAAPPAVPALDDCATLRDIVRAVRSSADEAGDWRAVVDGLRPHLDQLWVAFTAAEQEAFLRHLARPWECHRHRMAPSVAARVAELRAAGMFEVRAGGVRSIAAADGDLLAEFGTAASAAESATRAGSAGRAASAGSARNPRNWRAASGSSGHGGSAGVRERFGAVVNCSGAGLLPESAGAFVGGLLDSGLARVGPHRLGLDIDGGGRLIGADGSVQPRIWLIGPLRRGARWETTAVPEIRAQARRLAADLAAADVLPALLDAA